MDTERNEDEPSLEPNPESPLVWEPIKPLQSHLYYSVRRSDRCFAKSFDRLLKKTGIIASEWAALRELYRPQRWSPVELGAAIGMSKGGGSKLVSRLVAKGLVLKETNDFDRRFRSIGLTRQGRELVVFLAPLVQATDREFFGSLGNNRRFWMQQWMNRLLTSGRTQHMAQWMSLQLKRSDFTEVDPEGRAKAAAAAQAEADELWEYCRSVARAAALGIEPPSWPYS